MSGMSLEAPFNMKETLLAVTQPQKAKKNMMSSRIRGSMIRMKRDVRKNVGIESKKEELEREEAEDDAARVKTMIHMIGAGAVVAISLAAAYTAPFYPIFTYVAMSFPLCLGPYVAVQRRTIGKIGSFRKALNLVREEINRMDAENRKLTSLNDEVEREVQKLSVCESALQKIVAKQGESVDRVVGLLKENRKIQEQLTETIKARMVQDVVQAVMASDRSKDFTIDTNELEILLLRMKHVNGMDFDQNYMRGSVLRKSKLVGSQRRAHVSDVVEITRDMLNRSLDKEGSIFSSVKSEASPSLGVV